MKLMITDRVIVVSDSFESPGLLKALWGMGMNYIIYTIQVIVATTSSRCPSCNVIKALGRRAMNKKGVDNGGLRRDRQIQVDFCVE